MEDGLAVNEGSVGAVYVPVIAQPAFESTPALQQHVPPLLVGGSLLVMAARILYEKRRKRCSHDSCDGSTPLLQRHADAPQDEPPLRVAVDKQRALSEAPRESARCAGSPDTVVLLQPVEETAPFSWPFGTPAPLGRVELRVIAAAEVRRFFGLFWQLASAGALPVGSNWYVKSTQPTAACGFEPHLDPANVALAGAMIVRHLTRRCAEQVLHNDRSMADDVLCGAGGVGAKLCTRLETIEEMRSMARVAVQTVFGAAAPHDTVCCVRKQRQCEFMVLSEAPTASCAFCNPVDLFDVRLAHECGDAIEPHDAALCHSVATVLTVALLLVYDACDLEQLLHRQLKSHWSIVFFEAVCAVCRTGVGTGAARRALTFRTTSVSCAAAGALREAAPHVEESFRMCSLMLRVNDNDRVVRLCHEQTLLHAAAELSR